MSKYREEPAQPTAVSIHNSAGRGPPLEAVDVVVLSSVSANAHADTFDSDVQIHLLNGLVPVFHTTAVTTPASCPPPKAGQGYGSLGVMASGNDCVSFSVALR